MKSIILTICTLFFFVQHQDNTKDILNIDFGIDNLVVGKSTFENVINRLGMVKVIKRKVKPTETELFKHYEYIIYYPKLGLTFKSSDANKIIKEIIVDSSCQNFKTKNGFGIKSSYSDLKFEIGQPSFPNKTDKDKPMLFFNSNGHLLTETIVTTKNTTITFDSGDTTKCKVKQIVIYSQK